jgi:cell division protein FtsZ
MAGMGHAVMGTAVRSGSNRAIEAAQAAMASPLLDAGAIDGARGILINITGSSSLKLSEVNEASSLIESAAHEDANIIFGAVLDEKMGEEVKITVIATGFRDQMPERRARMLSVEEALVVSVPVVSTGNWMRERSPEPAAAPARFMSEEDDAVTENADDGFFFAAAAPGVATTVTVSSPAKQVAGHAMEFAANGESAPPTGQQSEGTASESDKQPRDFAPEFAATPRDGAEPGADTGASLFAGPAEQPERDLDVPTFLRRLKF